MQSLSENRQPMCLVTWPGCVRKMRVTYRGRLRYNFLNQTPNWYCMIKTGSPPAEKGGRLLRNTLPAPATLVCWKNRRRRCAETWFIGEEGGYIPACKPCERAVFLIFLSLSKGGGYKATCGENSFKFWTHWRKNGITKEPVRAAVTGQR